MNILITNDDSHDSPLLDFVFSHFKRLGALTVVVPKEEQSWKSKSMKVDQRLHVDRIVLEGRQALCVDGSPADCTNFGIYNACQSKPDLVVSGINAGLNAGISFAFSSGTIGACLEANIAGVPALALSQHLDDGLMQQFRDERTLPHDAVLRLREQTLKLLPTVTQHLAHLIERKPAVTWSVNLPYNASPECFAATYKPRLTTLAKTYYGSCFQAVSEHEYEWRVDALRHDPSRLSDAAQLFAGHVTLSVINISEFGQDSDNKCCFAFA